MRYVFFFLERAYCYARQLKAKVLPKGNFLWQLSILPFLMIVFLFASITGIEAAHLDDYTCSADAVQSPDLWWTGLGADNDWTTAENWSTSDPATMVTTAVSPPSTATNVWFTNESFPNMQAYVVEINSQVNCKSMRVTGTGMATDVTFNGNGGLGVYGSFELLPGISFLFSGVTTFKSGATGNVILTAGNEMKGNWVFDGSGGEWTLQDDLVFSGNSFNQIEFTVGSLVSNNFDITVGAIYSTGTNAGRKIDLGSSTVNIKNGVLHLHNEFIEFEASQATLYTDVDAYFDMVLWDNDNFIPIGSVVSEQGDLQLRLRHFIPIEKVVCEKSNLDMSRNFENYTIDTLNMSTGFTLTLANPKLNIDAIEIKSNCELFLRIVFGNINFTSYPANFNRVSLRSVKALINEAEPVPAIPVLAGRDEGGNVNFDITEYTTSRDLFWVGNGTSSNWFEPTNWSLSSGGAALSVGDCPPNILDNVFFDANSFNADQQFLDITDTNHSRVASCNNMIWQGLDQEDIDWIGSNNITLGGNLQLDGNMKADISYDKTMLLSNKVNGTLNFQSGSDNRRMKSMEIIYDIGASYTQLSDTVHIDRLLMGDAINYYNINSNTLRARIIERGGQINMEDAHIILEGSLAVYYRIAQLEYNNNSHIYVLNNTQFRFCDNWFPSITFLGTLIDNGSLKVDGNLNFVNEGAVFSNRLEVTDTLFLNPGKDYTIKEGAPEDTVKMNYIQSISSECGMGVNFGGVTGNIVNLDMPADGINVNFGVFTNINYVGTGELDLSTGNNSNGGGCSNINFATGIKQVFYWRPDSVTGSYTGHWHDAKHWAIHPDSIFGQTTGALCIPSTNDSIVFDALSGTGPSTVVLINNASVNIRSMTWVDEGQGNDSPAGMVLSLGGETNLTITEHISLSSTMVTSNSGASVVNYSTSDTIYLDLKGKVMGHNMILSQGTFIATSELAGGHVVMNSGELNANGIDCTFYSFFSTNSNPRTLNLSNSTMTLISYKNTGTYSGDPHASWNTGNATNFNFICNNSSISIEGVLTEHYFYGGGLSFEEVIFEPNVTGDYNFYHHGSNQYQEGLYIRGSSAIFDTTFTTAVLELSTNKNNVFPSGDSTFFTVNGNIEKSGDLNQFLNLTSSISDSMHYFKINTGGSIYVCNINVESISANGQAFKTNSVSTYNGIAGESSNLPPGSSWNFDSQSAFGIFDMLDSVDIHINRGDIAEVKWEIRDNDTGPFQLDYLNESGVQNMTVLSSGTDTTAGAFNVNTVTDEYIKMTEFQYFDCPGSYFPGSIKDSLTAVKVAPLNTTIAADGATEDYYFRNLDSYIYVMDGGDRSDTAAYTTRQAQLVINDFAATGDEDSLGMVTVSTAIDAAELAANDNSYMKRHWVFSNTGADADAKVKFFFTNSELQSLKLASTLDISDAELLDILKVEKFAGANTPLTAVGLEQTKWNTGVASEINDSTYYIEATVCGFAGNYYVSVAVPCSKVGLADAGGMTLGNKVCEKSGWTYYYSNSDPSKTLFAIEHMPAGGNTNVFTATASVSVTNDPSSANGIHSVVDPVAEEGNFIMGRYWNVELTSGSLNGGVNIRYYYDPVELAVVETAATDFANSTFPALEMSPAIWFKMVGTDFHPDSMETKIIRGGEVLEFTNPITGMEDGVHYVQLDGLTSFSGGGVAYRVSPDPNPGLPVELAAFDAYADDCKSVIRWKTSSEESFRYFSLERSEDGVSFDQIMTFNAAGGENMTQLYNYEDKESQNSNYYRLKMVDLDGSYEYSDVVFVQKDCDQPENDLTIYPNPVSESAGQINVRFYAEQAEVRFTLVNMLGQVIKVLNLSANEGWNTAILDISDLLPSNYILKVEDGHKVKTKPFIKIKL